MHHIFRLVKPFTFHRLVAYLLRIHRHAAITHYQYYIYPLIAHLYEIFETKNHLLRIGREYVREQSRSTFLKPLV